MTEVCRLAAKDGDRDGLHMLIQRTSDAYRLSPSITHAIEHSRRTQKDFVELFHVYNSGPLESCLDRLVTAYFDPLPVTWPLQKDAGKHITDCLDELCQTNDVLVRMLAERAETAFYGGNEYGGTVKPVDYVKAQKHAENYVNAVGEARLSYPRLIELYAAPLKNTKFSDNPQENDEFQRRMLAMLDPPPLSAPTNSVEFAAQQVLSLENALKVAPVTGWREPDSRIHEEMHFRRLMIGTNFAAIVYTQGVMSREHCGVLQLDPGTLRPRTFTSSSAEVSLKTLNGNLMSDYGRFGPSVAECDGDIFVGFPTSGIVRFRNDGTSDALNEANGLATDNVRGLDALDGKLYGFIGIVFGQSGVMEVDPKSGVSRILCSTKSKFSRSELDARPIRGIAADGDHHILWVLTPQGLFSYRPSDQSISNRTDLAAAVMKVVEWREYLSLQRQDDKLLVGGGRTCFTVNMRTERVEVLAASIRCPFGEITSRWRLASETPLRIAELLHGLAFKDAGNQAGRSALLCIDGRSAPVDLLNECFPAEVAAKLTLRDMAPADGGLLLLTDDALWLIPELRSKTRSP